MTTRALTDPELSQLLVTLRARGKYRDALFLLLGADTGFRASELLSIAWSQLLSPTGEVRPDVTVERAFLKGGAGARKKVVRSRRVPLTERVRAAVTDHLGARDSVPTGPVFKSRCGDDRAISREMAHRSLKRLARELGLETSRLAVHSLRKHFATRVHRAAHFDLVKTQRILNHSSPVTTAKYLETSQDELDAIILGGEVPAATPPRRRETAHLVGAF
jgi:integrase